MHVRPQVGDEYMCVSGIPRPTSDHACRMAMLALDMQHAIEKARYLTGVCRLRRRPPSAAARCPVLPAFASLRRSGGAEIPPRAASLRLCAVQTRRASCLSGTGPYDRIWLPSDRVWLPSDRVGPCHPI